MAYLGRAPINGRFIKIDDLSSQFNGILTTFNLTSQSSAIVPGTATNVIISLGGVVQEPEYAYTISGSTITFATAPASTQSFFGIVLGDVLDVGQLTTGVSIDVTSATLSSAYSTTTEALTIKNTSAGANGNLARVNFYLRNSTDGSTPVNTGRIEAVSTSASARDTDLLFWTANGANAITEQLRITANGTIIHRGYLGGVGVSAIASYKKNFIIGANAYNSTYNSGNSVLFLISDYSNDAGDNVYPIYVEDENNQPDFYLYAGNDGSIGTKKAYFGGNVLAGKTGGGSISDTGSEMSPAGYGMFVRDGNVPLYAGRKTSDGGLVELYQDGSLEGTISVSGATVTYGAFSGSHWSQLTDGSRPDILRGTVLESINALCEWPGESNERLPKCKVSDTAGSTHVYGVFMTWDNDWDTTNDMLVTSLGAFICRVHGSVTVQEGDLLESNGDGTARVQSDDIIRSRTIGKVTSTVKTHEYADGSYCVPTVLYCG